MGFVFLGAVVVEICFVEVGHVLDHHVLVVEWGVWWSKI